MNAEEGVGNREFFREQRGFRAKELLKSQFQFDMEGEKAMGRDPLAKLP